MTAEQATTDQKLLVETGSGPVRGIDNGGTLGWYGLPFAAAPVGDLRFRRPVPPEAWSATRDAAKPGPSPIQLILPEAFGGVERFPDISEDCLNLNVVRPKGAAADLPVMVWIYGGAFMQGSSVIYDAQVLAERTQTVVVTVNYRVGAFGFVDFSSLSGDAGSGDTRPFEANCGLYDQIAALRWVQENIAGFGGDSENVTIFGESAGAMSVLSLMCMPDAQGLFHRAIAQSPAPASSFPAEQHAQWARQLVEILEPGSADPAAALENAGAEDIKGALNRLRAELAQSGQGQPVASLCIDGESLPDTLMSVIARGQAARVPLIIGTNANEGALFQLAVQVTKYETIPVLPETVTRFLEGAPGKDALLAAYLDFPEPSTSALVGGDMSFWFPTLVTAASHSAYAPTWMYRYDYVSRRPEYCSMGPAAIQELARMPATHTSEITHVFGHSFTPEGEAGRDERDSRFSGALMDAWGTFARDGAPGSPEMPEWSRYDTGARQTMILDEDFRVEADPHGDRRRAWEALG